MDLVGRNNPWAKDWACPRKSCLPCEGRGLLTAENEEEALKKIDSRVAKEAIPKRSPEDMMSLPSCTSEGVDYVIECYTCRKSGREPTMEKPHVLPTKGGQNTRKR